MRTLAAARGFTTLLLALCAATASCAPAGAPWPTAGWAKSTPEAEGMDSAALARLVDYGATVGMDSVLVTRHGKLVLDAYYAPFGSGMRHAVNSVTKAVTATLVGIAVQEGRLATDQPVLPLFSEHAVAHADKKRSLQVQHLLDMTSGLAWTEPLDDRVPTSMLEMQRARDWAVYVLDRPMAQPPGTAFAYNSGNSHLLSAIVAKKAEGGPQTHAAAKLFGPLGITDVHWRKDPQGIPIGGYGVSLLPHDMAKLGYLYLRGGVWDGQRLLPDGWVKKVFDPQVDMQLAGTATQFKYANGWWGIPSKRAYMAVGLHRQLILVLPDLDVVAVVTGTQHYPFEALIDKLAAAAKSATPLPSDAVAAAALAARVQHAATERASSVAAVPELAASVSGRTYRMERNALGIRQLTLDLSAKNARYELVFDGGPAGGERRVVTAMGMDGTFRTSVQRGSVAAAKASWSGPDTLTMVARMLGDSMVATSVLRFSGNTVEVAYSNNFGFKTQARGEAVD